MLPAFTGPNVPMDFSKLLPRHAKTLLKLESLVAQSRPGDRLATERELCLKFDVSRETIRKAMRTLLDQGILESRQGSGTFVRKKIPSILNSEKTISKRTKLIGVSVPTVTWPGIAKVVSGMERTARELGYRIVLTHDEGDPERQLVQMRSLLEEGVEGLLVFLDRDNVTRPEYRKFFLEVQNQKEKIVLIDRALPGVDIPGVMADNAGGMYLITRHLIASGRKKIALLSWGPQAGLAEVSRLAGFHEAMRESGLDLKPVCHAEIGYSHPQEVSAQHAVEEWLRQSRGKLPFNAVISFVDNMAMGAFLALKEAGFQVPRDVALTGFGYLSPEVYRALGLNLTTVEQPFEEMGSVAARRLISGLATEGLGEKNSPGHSLLPTRLVIGTSA